MASVLISLALALSVAAQNRFCIGATSVSSDTSADTITCTWDAFTSGQFVTPDTSVSSIDLVLLGGDGGYGGTGIAGGAGASFSVSGYSVTAGETFNIYVGEKGGNGVANDGAGKPGGLSLYPGGGYAGGNGGTTQSPSATTPGGAGGGSATLLTQSDNSIIYLAGGGGGALTDTGGGAVNGQGSASQPGSPGGDGSAGGGANNFAFGLGGSADGTAGGSGGTSNANGNNGSNGSGSTATVPGLGGNGGDASDNEGGPGGGAGYAGGGGGGGGNNAGGGGGGSSLGAGQTAIATSPNVNNPAPYLSITFCAGPTVSGTPINGRRRLARSHRLRAQARALVDRQRLAWRHAL